jgi:hypothetical protein
MLAEQAMLMLPHIPRGALVHENPEGLLATALRHMQ